MFLEAEHCGGAGRFQRCRDREAEQPTTPESRNQPTGQPRVARALKKGRNAAHTIAFGFAESKVSK